MTFKMIAWTGEDVDHLRLSKVNSIRSRLIKSQTPQERRYCKFLSGICRKGSILNFTKQKVFHVHEQQAFVIDVYFRSFKLAVEIDGKHHESGLKKVEDEWRTKILNEHKITVIRFTNESVESDVYANVRDTIFALQDTGRHSRKLRKELAKASSRSPLLYSQVFSDK